VRARRQDLGHPDAVVWENGEAKPAGDQCRQVRAALARPDRRQRRQDRRADRRPASAQHAGAGRLRHHICDVEVDPEPAASTIAALHGRQDAGKAVHPSLCRGPVPGRCRQGIGWALNEEYIYGKDGKLQNAGFLDYRMPVCSDLPMIDTIIVEVPNPAIPMACAASARCRSCRRWRPSPTPAAPGGWSCRRSHLDLVIEFLKPADGAGDQDQLRALAA
jgi:CO/xanthine dehydrogenase Mo-binding subunit